MVPGGRNLLNQRTGYRNVVPFRFRSGSVPVLHPRERSLLLLESTNTNTININIRHRHPNSSRLVQHGHWQHDSFTASLTNGGHPTSSDASSPRRVCPGEEVAKYSDDEQVRHDHIRSEDNSQLIGSYTNIHRGIAGKIK